MPRSKREGRGSRSAIPISGATVGLFPSGVTISQTGLQHSGGVVTTAQMGYLDDLTSYAIEHPSTSNTMVSGGSQAWTGTSLEIATGLSTVAIFLASLNIDAASATSAPNTVWINTGVAGEVTAKLMASVITTGGVSLVPSGGTITWMAFGL